MDNVVVRAKLLRDMVGAWGFEPQTPTVSNRSTLSKANKSGILLRNAAPPDQLPDQPAQREDPS
jgi:hypothetical protein